MYKSGPVGLAARILALKLEARMQLWYKARALTERSILPSANHFVKEGKFILLKHTYTDTSYRGVQCNFRWTESIQGVYGGLTPRGK